MRLLFFIAILFSTCVSGQKMYSDYPRNFGNRQTAAPIPRRYYTAHFMTAFQHHTSDLIGWVQSMKAAGYNAIWAHSDTYGGFYSTNLSDLFDACDSVGDIVVIPGVHGNAWETIAMIQESWDKPALMKINDKPVITAWNYDGTQRPIIKAALEAVGITEDDYIFIPHAFSPYTWDNGASYIGESTNGDGIKVYAQTNGFFQIFGGRLQLRHLYEVRPEMDGYMTLAIDYGNSGTNQSTLLETNALGVLESNSLGKYFFSGINGLYASAQYNDFNFSGLVGQWEAILSTPTFDRPLGVCDATADDYVELSYMSPLLNTPVNGLGYLPHINAGYNLGSHMRIPLVDHSGMQEFCRPYVDAFLNDQRTPTFSEEKMFCWYFLHPKTAPIESTIPAALVGKLGIDQDFWNTTVYGSDPGTVNYIRTIMSPIVDNIRMGVHLTSPAYLKINNTVSELKQAGAAWFDIPMGDFRGIPTFSILNENLSVRITGVGEQPITDSRWPGGFTPLIKFITPGIITPEE